MNLLRKICPPRPAPVNPADPYGLLGLGCPAGQKKQYVVYDCPTGKLVRQTVPDSSQLGPAVDQLQTDVAALQSEVVALETSVGALGPALATLQADVDSVEALVAALQGDVLALEGLANFGPQVIYNVESDLSGGLLSNSLGVSGTTGLFQDALLPPLGGVQAQNSLVMESYLIEGRALAIGQPDLLGSAIQALALTIYTGTSLLQANLEIGPVAAGQVATREFSITLSAQILDATISTYRLRGITHQQLPASSIVSRFVEEESFAPTSLGYTSPWEIRIDPDGIIEPGVLLRCVAMRVTRIPRRP